MADLTRSQLAQQLRDRHTPATQIREALAIINAINGRMGGAAGGSWTHGQVVSLHRKWIVENAGEPVYAGMRPATLPEGRCRWCIARLHARSHDQPLPEASDLNRILLGRMCKQCAKAKVSAIVAHAAYVTRRRDLGRTADALIASAGARVIARDSKGRATRIKITEPGYRFQSRAAKRRQSRAGHRRPLRRLRQAAERPTYVGVRDVSRLGGWWRPAVRMISPEVLVQLHDWQPVTNASVALPRGRRYRKRLSSRAMRRRWERQQRRNRAR